MRRFLIKTNATCSEIGFKPMMVCEGILDEEMSINGREVFELRHPIIYKENGSMGIELFDSEYLVEIKDYDNIDEIKLNEYNEFKNREFDRMFGL